MPNNLTLPGSGKENKFLANKINAGQQPAIANNNQPLKVNNSMLPTYTRGQKIGAIVLAFFALFIIIAWFIQLKSGINREINPVADNNGSVTKEEVNTAADQLAKQKDTDGDGLSDWDELNTHLTSPYLEDTDSDGFSDKEEIATSNDPNCPVNTECYSEDPESGESGNTAAGTETDSDVMRQLNNLSLELDQTGAESEKETKTLQDILGGQGNVADLRKMLLDSGMDETMLNQITDEELMDTYKNMLSE